MDRVLITEDDITFAQILERYLSRHGYEVVLTHNIEQAKAVLSKDKEFHAMLLDYRLPDGNGLDVLDFKIHHNIKIPVIMMTSFNDVKVAVQCIKKGAYEYITKPINQEELLMLLKNAGPAEPVAVKEEPKIETEETTVIKSGFVKGTSDAAQVLHQHVALVAQTEMSVLINGESGTGKEHIARALHDTSKRSSKPFVAVDCGALSSELAASELFGHVKGAFTGAIIDKTGIFELANGGTIFLDEVGNLSYDVQVKLLRAIEQREVVPVGSHKVIKVNVRLVTATNEDFKSAIQSTSFREDLYHRINEFKIKIPALRERREDIDEFIRYFIQKSNQELQKNVRGVDAEVRKIFMQYHWPGNIRELKNIIKRAVLLTQSDLITRMELPEDMELSLMEQELEPTADLKAVQQQTEKELIIRTLAETKYNKSKAAKLLNIDRTTLYNKLAKYGIDDV